MRNGEQRTLTVFGFLLPFFLANLVYAQVWIRTYDGPARGMDNSYALCLDPQGNVLVTGYATISHNGDTIPNYCTIKYDPDGVLQWVRFFDYGFGLAIATDSSGNVYVTGDKVTIKYYPDGDCAWVRTYGEYFWGSDLIVDPQGNVYVTGYVDIATPIMYYPVTIKYNRHGDQEWVRVDSGGPGWTASIALDTAGNVYVAGFGSSHPNLPSGYLVMKYAPDGNLLWRVCEDSINGAINEVKLSLQGDGLYVTGSLNDNIGPYVAATAKYNLNGEQQWVRFFDGPGYDVGQSLTVDRDDNCYVAVGTAERPGMVTNFDIVLIKYAPDGTVVYEKRYTGYGWDEYPHAICLDSSNCCYVGGYSGSPRSNTAWGRDYTLLKYDPFGNLIWEARYCGDDSLEAWLYDLKIDNQGYIYTTGFVGTGTVDSFDYDWCVMKYPPTGPGIAESSEKKPGSLRVILYPNPAHTSFTVKTSFSFDRIFLYDVAGKLVKTYKNGGDIKAVTLQLDGVKSGVYFAQVGNQTEKLIVKR